MTQAVKEQMTDPDAQALRSAMRVLVRRFSISERADVSCCGMTVAQAATLEVLDLEGATRLGDLGRRLGISPSTLTRNLDRLEERGLIRRRADTGDGRVQRAALTAAGRRSARDIERQDLAFAREVLRRLPASRRASMLTNLSALLVAVRQATETCCPGAFDHLMKEFPGKECEA